MRQLILPPHVTGRSVYRNRGSGDKLWAAAPTPNLGYTLCGWAQQVSLRASFYNVMACAVDSVTSATQGQEYGWTSAGAFYADDFHVDTPFATNYTTGERFFWCLSWDGGAGGTTGTCYARRWRDANFQTVNINPSLGTTGFFILGDSDDASNNWADVRIWNVKSFSRKLTDSEVMRESLYAAPRSSNLWSWWPLEGSGSQYHYDYSGNSRHLTKAGSGRAEPFFLPQSIIRPILTPMTVNAPAAAGTAPVPTPKYQVMRSLLNF